MTRYDSYKSTGNAWINEIPEHWIMEKLRFIGNFSASGIDKKVIEGEPLVKIVNYTDIYGNQSRILNNQRKYMEVSCSVEKKVEHQVKIGDLIFTPSSETIEDLGLSALVDEDLTNTAYSYHVLRFRFVMEVDHNFKKYLCNNHFVLNQFSKEAKGTTRQILNRENFNCKLVFLPPLSEQKTISNYLDEKTTLIDSFIEKKKKLIELLKEERTALINHAITKGINPNAKMKPSGIDWLGDIPEHWEVKKLKYVVEINSSKKNYEFNKNSDDEVVFLPMEKVSENGEINQVLKKKISEVSSGFTYFERNDIIIAKITPCFENGKGALLSNLETNFGYGSTEYHTLRTSNSLSKEFLFFITKSERFMTIGEAFMSGSAGQKRVPTNFVQDFIIGICDIEEQFEIVKFIKTESQKIDLTISTIEKEIELIKEYRTALISEVVTGKVRVE